MSAVTPAHFTRLSLRKIFAASTLVLCTLAGPAAYAQNSGGGWVAYQVPNPPPYVPGADIDWTGLTVSSTTVHYDGSSTSNTGPSYVSYFTIGDNVGANTNQSISYSVTGPSTYKWNWTPTGSDVGAPAPPLYVLARASGGACLRPNNEGHISGLSGSATFNFASSVPAYTFGPLEILTQYKVMPAPGSVPAVVGVSPTLTANMSGSSVGDEGYSTLFISTTASPIVLAGPDPMGRPDLGDGSNQRVYGAEQPNGQLTVPASVYVPNASTDGTTFLLPHVALSVSPVMQTGAQPFTFTASGPNMLVNTTSARPGYTSPWPSGQFCYISLPPDNTYFGNHVMTMSVDGTASQTAIYQLFFSKNGQNFPGCDATRQIDWYHYYNLVYPSPDDDPAVEVDATFDINLNQYGQTEWYPPSNFNSNVMYSYGFGGWLAGVTIGNQAGGAASLPIFDLGGPNGLVRYIGSLYIKGIQTYVLTCAHEQAHRTLMQDGIYYPYTPSDGPPYGFADVDGDGLSDVWESAHHLGPANPDTTGYYASNPAYNYGDTGDLECLCEILAFKGLLANKALWQQDWSDGGLQIGVVPTPDFYWQFRPAVTAGGYTAGNTYEVRTLADLNQAYPTVLSDLP